MYDIIGDTHGHATRLEALLTKLGYSKKADAWQHPERKALLLGDLIDRGPEQLEAVRIVKAMVEAGSALCILGNHEFNAVSFGLPDPDQDGAFLRVHTKENREKHQGFLEQVGEGSLLHREILAWFKTLPLYMDLDGLRAVHACWHPAHIQAMQPYLTPQGSLREDAWIAANRSGSIACEGVKTLLKGMEIALPPGISFQDKNGITRHAIRARWWDREARTYEELGVLTENPRHRLPAVPVDTSVLPGYDQRKPVFFGHYWLHGTPRPLAPTIACLDYSSVLPAPAGKLCAYRWNGEQTLLPSNFEWV